MESNRAEDAVIIDMNNVPKNNDLTEIEDRCQCFLLYIWKIKSGFLMRTEYLLFRLKRRNLIILFSVIILLAVDGVNSMSVYLKKAKVYNLIQKYDVCFVSINKE